MPAGELGLLDAHLRSVRPYDEGDIALVVDEWSQIISLAGLEVRAPTTIVVDANGEIAMTRVGDAMDWWADPFAIFNQVQRTPQEPELLDEVAQVIPQIAAQAGCQTGFTSSTAAVEVVQGRVTAPVTLHVPPLYTVYPETVRVAWSSADKVFPELYSAISVPAQEIRQHKIREQQPGMLQVNVPLRAGHEIGRFDVQGTLLFRGCRAEVCWPVVRVPFVLDVEVVSATWTHNRAAP